MELNWTLVAIALAPIAVLALLMNRMAANRRLSQMAWTLIAFVPIVNVLALLVLALKPLPRSATG
jgi:lipoprotein signal peptidase